MIFFFFFSDHVDGRVYDIVSFIDKWHTLSQAWTINCPKDCFPGTTYSEHLRNLQAWGSGDHQL